MNTWFGWLGALWPRSRAVAPEPEEPAAAKVANKAASLDLGSRVGSATLRAGSHTSSVLQPGAQSPPLPVDAGGHSPAPAAGKKQWDMLL